MVTISDVAKEAKVSVATVSRVLNHSGKVKPETADRVKTAIDKMQYTINVSARNLRKNESGVLMVLARNFTNPFYAKVLAGISDEAGRAGFTIMMTVSGGDVKTGAQCIRILEGNQADGVILLNCTEDDVAWLAPQLGHYPIVQCCEYVPELHTPKVIVDHLATGYEAVRYLASLGHRRIAFMGAENKHSSTILRLQGYRQAVKDMGLEEQETLVVSADGNYTFESGSRAAHLLLEQEKPPTAVFCVSDVLALSCILAAKELGMQVPEGLSVVGCDDVDYTMMTHPFLTTFRLPCYELGQQSARQLLECIHGTAEGREEITLDFSLQIRESSGIPRADEGAAITG